MCDDTRTRVDSCGKSVKDPSMDGTVFTSSSQCVLNFDALYLQGSFQATPAENAGCLRKMCKCKAMINCGRRCVYGGCS